MDSIVLLHKTNSYSSYCICCQCNNICEYDPYSDNYDDREVILCKICNIRYSICPTYVDEFGDIFDEYIVDINDIPDSSKNIINNFIKKNYLKIIDYDFCKVKLMNKT